MNSAANQVYVIIVSYNFLRWAERCLGSLRVSNYPVKTVVVDNASTDDTVAFVRERFPEITVIANEANRGFGAANNQGMALAMEEGADFVFLLNQDTWIFPETVGRLVQAMRHAPQYGIVSPLHYAADEVTLDAAFQGYISKDYVQRPETLTDQAVYTSRFINAAAWLVSRQCLADTGGFGDLFYHYGEDHDFVQRTRYYRYKLGFAPLSRIVHDRPPTRFVIDTAEKAIWYYTIGVRARLADINRPYAVVWIGVAMWLMRDMIALLLKGKWFAIPAAMKIYTCVFLKEARKILRYRRKVTVAGGTKFLFLKEENA